MSTSIATRFGLGVGVGVGSGVGVGVAPGAGVTGTGVISGVGDGSSGGSVMRTVATVGRSGGGPAKNRSTRLRTDCQRSPAPNASVATSERPDAAEHERQHHDADHDAA